MAEASRYNVSDDDAGLEKGVLKNKSGIKNEKRLQNVESLLLIDAIAHFTRLAKEGKIVFDLSLIFEIQRYFLGNLYDWAGKVRKVEISKDGVLFAPVIRINDSLKKFEKLLQKNQPRKGDSKKQIAQKLAIIHNEFNAIHPFREGNGRTIRLFMDLMAVNADYQPIDFGKSSKKSYIFACQRGIVLDHSKMERVIYKGLRKNNKKYE